MTAKLDERTLDHYLAIAIAIGEMADALLLRGYGLAVAQRKADGTLVTQTDHAVDAAVTNYLHTHCPDHGLLSEERNTVYDPAHTFTWVVDPLDGTTNFARGLPLFGFSLALLCAGTPVLGLLSFPVIRERYVFVMGRPPTYNDQPLVPHAADQPNDENFIMMCTRTPRRYRVTTPLKARILGSAAYHLALVARGVGCAVIEATPKLWDLAAAIPLLVAAGGSYQGLVDQSPLFPLLPQRRDYGTLSYPLVAAATPTLLAAVAAGIEPIHR